MPTGILGIPHCVIQDDEYMGYKIPKGAGVMCTYLPWTPFFFLLKALLGAGKCHPQNHFAVALAFRDVGQSADM